MLCITGAETSLAALSARLDEEADLHELRLDHLTDAWGDGLWALVERHAGRLLLCCRPAREGGAYAGDEAARLGWLKRGLDLGVRWVDVEGDVPSSELSGFAADRMVRSFHRFTAADEPMEVMRLARALGDAKGAVSKLAIAVDDAAHLDVLLDARRSIDGDAVLIGMGPAGLVSRARYPHFGSAWTYVAADARTATAPGQLDRAGAAHQGLPQAALAPFAALVGGPQVFGSPGPSVYPPLFRARGLAVGSYLPVVTLDLARALPLLERLGAVGLSVTMPLKQEAARRARGDELVARLGAANSLRLKSGRWEATNTDVAGVEVPLRTALAAGGTALVLGAGGAAAAAVEAAQRMGLQVCVSSRRDEAAASLAARFDGVSAVAWSARGDWVGDVLVNATPVAGETASPWPDVPVGASVVFDLALGKPALALRRQAEAGGARFLPPEAMWRAQGAAQMSWFFDQAIEPSELKS